MSASAFSRAAGLGALSAAGQLVIVGSLPAYSRTFDPGPYGEYLIFVGAIGVLGVFAGLRYDSAIVLPRNERIASALSGLVVLLAVTVAAIIALATWLARSLDWGAHGWGHFGRDFGYALSAATVLGALQRCLTSWCIRRARFLSMGWAQFVFCVVTVIGQLSLARTLGALPALIWGYVCALAVQAAWLGLPMLGATRTAWWGAPSLHWMKAAAFKYRRFPTYMVGYALASSTRDRLIQIILGIGAGAAVVGRFGLAYRVAFAPNSLLYSAVSPVFFAIASRRTRQAVGRFAAGLVECTFVSMVVPYVAFALEAPTLTDQLLSGKWHGTGTYLQALAGPALLLASTCWLDRAFDSFRRQNVAFTLEACFTTASVVLIASLVKLIDPVAVAWAFSALAVVYYWTYFLTTFVACGFPLKDFRRAFTTGTFAAAAALCMGWTAHRVPGLALRLIAYMVAMAIIVAWWMRFRGGFDTMRLLAQSRVGGPEPQAKQPPGQNNNLA